MNSGIVFDLQRGALRDGPGIRTTVFLKGCPLVCRWCHNPESRQLAPEVGVSGKVYGQHMTVEEVMSQVLRDRPFYETSGGGITLSGGEPTVQFGFCCALLEAARAAGISTCLDTSGHCDPERFRALIPLTDLFLFDYKATVGLKALTGVDGAWIAENLEQIRETGAPVRLRCPMIPGINDSPTHLGAIQEMADRLPGLRGVDVLPYHPFGHAKAEDLRSCRGQLTFRNPEDTDRARWRDALPLATLQ